MCRILARRQVTPFELEPILTEFAAMCEASPEYQGHGWGMAYRCNGKWSLHRQIEPVWQSSLSGFGQADLLLLHARSAFRNEGIEVANNMPFDDGRHFFIFNGELHGVRIKADGRIGAEKIFNYIKRFHKGNLEQAFRKATDIIEARSAYVRAMNILMTDGEQIYLTSRYGEDPDYFAMYHHKDDIAETFCSQPLGEGYEVLPNHTTMVV